jgi:hypothetical protein
MRSVGARHSEHGVPIGTAPSGSSKIISWSHTRQRRRTCAYITRMLERIRRILPLMLDRSCYVGRIFVSSLFRHEARLNARPLTITFQ